MISIRRLRPWSQLAAVLGMALGFGLVRWLGPEGAVAVVVAGLCPLAIRRLWDGDLGVLAVADRWGGSGSRTVQGIAMIAAGEAVRLFSKLTTFGVILMLIAVMARALRTIWDHLA